MKPKLYLLIVFVLSTLSSLAQPGALDLSFDPGTGADSTVLVTYVQSDGKILLGGTFSTYNGQPCSRFARLNADGSLDNSFSSTGANYKVYSITQQQDGKILVGGSFTFFNGDSAFKFIRLLPNGETDTSFRADRFISRVSEVIVQPDGKILVGGSFSSINELPYINLARLYSNGKLDTTFNTQNCMNGTVETMALQPDGKLLIAGSFTQYFGVQGYRIARVNTDGSADTTFNPGIGGAGSTVEAIHLRPDGKIMLCGQFSFYNGTTVGHLVLTNSDGTIDFSYPHFPAANLPIYALAALPHGGYLFGGSFSTYQTNPAANIVSVRPDGGFNSQFNPGTGTDNEITALTIYKQTKVLVSGYFTTYNGTFRNRIARLYNCLTQQPDSIYGNSYALCSGTPQTYSVNPVAGATRYEWTLPNGWSGTSASSSITATSNGTGGIVSVKAFTDSCGWSYLTTRNINTITPPGVNICLVTVDTASTHNIVVWEKPQTSLIDSFFIYRETSTNTYTKIASVPYNELSEYHDTTANPNTTSYRYKLSVLDTCGAESALSPYHSTIHLQNLGSGNFQWTFYQIENQQNPVQSFNVYRDNLGNGNYFPIGNVPGTNATFTDVTFGSFTNSIYVLDANWGISCNPTRQVNTTRSNIRNKGTIDITPIGIDELNASDFEIYPNPTDGALNISFPATANVATLQLSNMMGQVVFSKTGNITTPAQINFETLPKGVYTLSLQTEMGKINRRISLR
jgi:uncharacterized delta-60 repeat protein